jgi:hypothetical protein
MLKKDPINNVNTVKKATIAERKFTQIFTMASGTFWIFIVPG